MQKVKCVHNILLSLGIEGQGGGGVKYRIKQEAFQDEEEKEQ